MNKTPYISVMVLCYNYAKYLHRALFKVSMQTYTDFELIFINNGSTDNSEEVFNRFREEHPEINTVAVRIEQNQGPVHGWMEGIKAAKGKYIMFCDADDTMDSNCLEVLARAARENEEPDRIFGQYREVEDSRRPYRRVSAISEPKILRVRRFAKKSSDVPTPMLQGGIIKRETFLANDIHPYEYNYIAYDADITYSMALVEKTKPVFVPETIYAYYISPNSMAHNGNRAVRNLGELVNVSRETLKHYGECATEDKRNQVLYLTTKNLYAEIIDSYISRDYSEAKAIKKQLIAMLRESFPEYKDNPYIKPIGNGYETSASIAVWMLIKLEKVKLDSVVQALLSALFFFKRRSQLRKELLNNAK